MKDKHEQLYVAVQDLLIELGITPKRLRDIAANKTHNSINPKTAQKLIDADIIVEQMNWRVPGNVSGPYQRTNETNTFQDKELFFNKIKSGLAPGILWEYLQKEHHDFLSSKINGLLTLPPTILWSYLREKYSGFLSDAVKDYLSSSDEPHQKTDKANSSLFENAASSRFDKIKPFLAPRILWEYLAEKHPDFLESEARTYLCNS